MLFFFFLLLKSFRCQNQRTKQSCKSLLVSNNLHCACCASSMSEDIHWTDRQKDTGVDRLIVQSANGCERRTTSRHRSGHAPPSRRIRFGSLCFSKGAVQRISLFSAPITHPSPSPLYMYLSTPGLHSKNDLPVLLLLSPLPLSLHISRAVSLSDSTMGSL